MSRHLPVFSVAIYPCSLRTLSHLRTVFFFVPISELMVLTFLIKKPLFLLALRIRYKKSQTAFFIFL